MRSGKDETKRRGKAGKAVISEVPLKPGEAAVRASGSLFVVASPIGNLRDITLRALDVFRSVALVAAEDTRRTRKLLSAYSIKTKLFSLNEHTERVKSPTLIQKILKGEDIAYVSDAGTPGISDPGFTLISKALEAGVPVVPIPGASAAITALSVSGLPMNRFLFVGFLPASSNAKRSVLASLRDREETVVFFESPLRLLATLEDLLAVWGERQAMIAREMSKVYEEFQRGNLSELLETFTAKTTLKGEVTIVIAGGKIEKEKCSQENLRAKVALLMQSKGFSHSEAARKISAETGIPKSTVYHLSLNKD